LLSSSNDQLLKRWDVASGRCLGSWPERVAGNWFKAVALRGDGTLVVTGSGDTKVQIWRGAQTNDTVEHTQLLGHEGQIWTVSLSGEAKLLASADHLGTILVWDLESGKSLRRLTTERPYERMNISGIRGVSPSQRAALRALGAIDDAG
jgi:WD40 repeat protein